ncbi:MAG: hypothetical protein RIS26_10 [Actinomycetota bacterium]
MNEFIGVSELKAQQAHQVQRFRAWAEASDWNSFHINHYDWWTFPITAPSSFGYKYSVTPEAISELKEDSKFLESLDEAAALLLLSWGWSVEANAEVPKPDPNQEWANWPIRLSKCYRSLILFERTQVATSAERFAKLLHSRGVSFEYNGRDLSTIGGKNERILSRVSLGW